jgi:actin
VEIGDSFAQVASVYEWTQLPQTLLRTELGGTAVSRFFLKSLRDTSYHFSNPNGIALAQKIKEALGFIALDFQETAAQQADRAIEYELAADTKIQVGAQRYRCPELLFNPKLDGLSCFSVAELVYESVMRADVGLRPELWSNVVVSGGTTMCNGFGERLKMELAKLAPGVEINLVMAPDRTKSVWIGGSILGSLALFGQMVVTSEEYRESGSAAVRRRFY